MYRNLLLCDVSYNKGLDQLNRSKAKLTGMTVFFSCILYYQGHYGSNSYWFHSCVLNLISVYFKEGFALTVHTVSSQNFRSFCFLLFFLSFYLSKIVQLIFFREIATYTSRLLPSDKFFSMVLIIDNFMTLIP